MGAWSFLTEYLALGCHRFDKSTEIRELVPDPQHPDFEIYGLESSRISSKSYPPPRIPIISFKHKNKAIQPFKLAFNIYVSDKLFR